jgi:catechol 2,3-dioxygenase-like lactoylglutathione lyase family enzyme
MGFIRTDHTGMSVENMDKCIAFYQDVIGMSKTFDREFDVQMGRLIGVPGTRVRIVHMRLGESVVELFDYHYPQGRAPRPDPQQSDFGLIHIGFMVEDFWATYKHLVAKGVQFLGEAFEFRPGVFVAYFHGAEHEVCEMREIIPQPK